MSATGFLNSIGCIPEVDMRKKILKLANGSYRTIYDLQGDDIINHCKYCGEMFADCECTRTEHVFMYDEGNSGAGHCALCLEPFAPNGTGPSNSPFLHWLLNTLSWFSRWVTMISNKHDIGYFEGFSQIRKTVEDRDMLVRTHDKIEDTWWLRPHWLWKKRANVNWNAVDRRGDPSFNWSGCVCEPKKPNKSKDIPPV